MTNGEKMVWAAAFVSRLSDVNDPTLMNLLSRKDEIYVAEGLRELTTAATDFADLAVNAMGCAKKELIKDKKEDTTEYKRLVIMIDGGKHDTS